MPKPYQSSIGLVREFHETFNHPVANDLTPGTKELRRLRVMLIASELAELAQALGVPVELAVFPDYDSMPGVQAGRAGVTVRNGMVAALNVAHADRCAHEVHVDMVEAADALGDIDYVTQGANLVFGIPAGLVSTAIHASNMSKLGADSKPIYDADGKVVKGPNYAPPDIKRILKMFDRGVEL